MIKTKRFAVMAVVLILALMSMPVGSIAFADSPNVIQASITLLPGDLRLETQPIVFDRSGCASPTWQVIDARGSGAGWLVDIACIGDSPCALIVMEDDDVRLGTIGSGKKPKSLVQDTVEITQTPLTILHASPDEGMGTFEFSPKIHLATSLDIALLVTISDSG